MSTDILSNTTDSLTFGKYSVGFHVNEYNDSSRSSRSIRIYTWYPAEVTASDHQTTVSDYLQDNFFRKGSKKKWEVVLSRKTNSFFEADRIPEPFPLIVIGQGFHFESAISLATLAEYLASYGYVVSSCPLKGTKKGSVTLDLADLTTQIRDMKFVLAKIVETHQTDSEIGVIGFDLGGLSSALLCMNKTNIDCLISLDGGLMFQHNLDYIKQSRFYAPLQLKIPIFQITRTSLENEAMGITEDFSFFTSVNFSKKYLLRFENINHREFTSFNLMGIENYGSEKIFIHEGEIHEAVPILYEYILHFMNAYLKNNKLSLVHINRPVSEHNFEIPVTLELFESKPVKVKISDIE